MMTRNCGKQVKFHTLTNENLVPEYHFLRKLVGRQRVKIKYWAECRY
jgi:hypothetical protein